VAGALRQIVYISRAARGCDDDQVAEIGRRSRIRNQENNITGLLLFDGSRFIQAIEGPPDAVQATIERIRSDQRHDNFQVAADREIGSRQFGSWGMQTRRTADGACSATFLRRIKDQMRSVDDTALQALFIGFTVLGTPPQISGGAR
jgi:hypothetical protein